MSTGSIPEDLSSITQMPQTRVVAERVSQPKKNRCELCPHLKHEILSELL